MEKSYFGCKRMYQLPPGVREGDRRREGKEGRMICKGVNVKILRLYEREWRPINMYETFYFCLSR